MLRLKYNLVIRELIDTLWNVNLLISPELLKDEGRINRYIMECKLIWIALFAFGCTELIDTLWNVNMKFFTLFICLVLELIDTLWNVNIAINTIWI